MSKTPQTRKSSCVNARGIPTAAYQLLHRVPSPPGLDLTGGGVVPEVGYPTLGKLLKSYKTGRTHCESRSHLAAVYVFGTDGQSLMHNSEKTVCFKVSNQYG